jgi:hypothetical protein
MKIVSFIFVSVILIGCFQKQPKEIAKNDSLPKPLTIETVEITDSTSFDNYSVDIDTVYFYARADSNTKMDTYLTKNTSTVICKKNGEFGYAVRLTDSVIQPRGWLKLKYLTQIFFTPPKIVKD